MSIQPKKQNYLKLITKIINENQYFLVLKVNNYTNNKVLDLKSMVKKTGDVALKLKNGIWNYWYKNNSEMHVKEDSVLIAFKNKQNYVLFKNKFAELNLSEVAYLKEADKISETYIYPEGPTKLKGASFYAILEPVVSIRLQKNMIVLEKPFVIEANKKITHAQAEALKVLKVPLKKRKVHLSRIFVKRDADLVNLSKEYITTYLHLEVTRPAFEKAIAYLKKTLYPTCNMFLRSRFNNFLGNFKRINNKSIIVNH